MTIDKFRILLVDDNPGDAQLTRLALQEARIHSDLDHVVDGIEALEYLRRQGRYTDRPRPHLMLLDLNMPRMDGHQLLAEIKKDETLRSIPVVMLTTSDVERDVCHSYDLGAAGFITKPVAYDTLVDALRRLEGYWFALVRLPVTA
ncbi:MAG: response regulator [Actinomycetota bacterium]